MSEHKVNPVCNIKKLSVAFLCGIAIPIFILIITGALGIIPPIKSDLILSKWHISEPNSNTLLISLKNSLDDTPITVGIEINEKTNYLDRIGVVINKKEDDNISFAYSTKGKYRAPCVFYGTNMGFVWRDLNADGQFDQRLDYPQQKMEIYVEDSWIEGKGTQDIQTDKGNFIFDITSGYWHPGDKKGSE